MAFKIFCLWYLALICNNIFVGFAIYRDALVQLAEDSYEHDDSDFVDSDDENALKDVVRICAAVHDSRDFVANSSS